MLKTAKEFVTVCIYNNKGGKDEQTLKSFNEPAWNNPVVRFLDADGKDLIPREDGVYRTEDVLERMKAALKKAAPPLGKSEAVQTPEAKSPDVPQAGAEEKK